MFPFSSRISPFLPVAVVVEVVLTGYDVDTTTLIGVPVKISGEVVVPR